MTDFNWLSHELVRQIHDEQLAEHGGLPGIRDQNALDATLARPEQKHYYQPASSVFELAASYAYGFARNHPFSDGNKRTALLAAYVFLADNGWELDADEDAARDTFLDLAAGNLSEEALAEWLEQESIPFE
ncbi:type II toxin-antitoxin system death-on-curing family toxin [Parahaliea mediterranea]|uniref:type II toxin-antitoxin system death-on-curing family toxin n=1 Tax=Parahaliea mediterranea TaxID=651086 RepID=UPI000E2EF753|nr:type II toxin-antitoxin system death-on-curing family toxin [Parahaliea mediterranea]